MKATLLLMLLMLGALAQQQNNNNNNNTTLLQQVQSILSNQTEGVSNNTQVIQSILSSGCGSLFEQQLSLQPDSNYTLFLPSDDAFGSLSELILSGMLRISCSRHGKNCTANPFASFVTESRGSLSSVLDCIPEIFAYHVVPNNSFYIHSPSGNSSSNYSSSNQTAEPFGNVTVLETSLNTTAFVNLPNGAGQVLVVNKTINDTFVNFGFERPARIVYPNLNMTSADGKGVIHLVDGILVPPFPLNLTLQIANLTLFANSLSGNSSNTSSSTNSSNNGTAQSIYNATGITVFAPINEAIQSGSIDPLRYVVQGNVIYANSSLSLPMNLTNMANETIALSTANDSLQFGNATVIHANIPISNGVLHVLNSSLLSETGSNNSTRTTSRSTNQGRLIGRGRRARLVGR